MVTENRTNTLARLRDELNLQKGAYNETVKNNKIAMEEIKKILDGITPEQLTVLQNFGVDTNVLLNMDVEKLTTDKNYLAQIKQTVTTACDDITANLEKVLGVNVNV